MTRDEVLALAREVGLWEMLEGYSSEYGSLDAEEDCLPELERFVALVAAEKDKEIKMLAKALKAEQKKNKELISVMSDSVETAVRSAAKAERKRILEMCKEGWWDGEGIRYHLEQQDAIRSRT